MREETRYDAIMKRYYYVRHYCLPEKENYEHDFEGVKSQGTIRATGFNIKTNHYFVAYY